MRVRVGKVLGLAALSFLGGCVTWTGPVSVPAQRPSPASLAYFDFSWELSGDRQAAPLQVFDDGRRMWLQFSPSQGEPGVWRPAPEGDLRAVDYSRQGPYLVLEQVWPELVVQVRDRRASVRRQASPASLDELTPPAPPATAVASPPGSETAMAAATAEPIAEAVDDAPGVSFAVERIDGHMRRTLARWAQQAGWVFQAEHWSVDVDIPIVGEAVFDMPFEQAVQALLASTELSDRPLQPCFYSNRVVRVVAFAQACDRTAPPGERA